MPAPAPIATHAPDAYEALLAAERCARRHVDGDVLLAVEQRIAAALGAAPELPEPDGERDAALAALVDQFAVDVTGITPAMRGRLDAFLAEGELPTLLQAVYLLDMLQRLRATSGALFGDGVADRLPVGPAAPASSDLYGALRAVHAAAMLLDRLDPETTEIVRIRCARHHQCST